MLERIRKNLFTIVTTMGIIVGVGLLLYPSVSNYWNSFHQSRAMMTYQEQVTRLKAEEKAKMLEDARAYNSRIAETGILWKMTDEEKKEYDSLLKVNGTEVMGCLCMPKFHINVPIYHGTEESVLQIAIGHVEGSSLPVGGKGSHCLISGHRGLPSARLFTDLDKVRKGDTWTITTLDETITYECDQIKTVLPDDIRFLQIEQGKDLCTLITCTPYGVNTHRLLVRGHRIPNVDGAANLTADAVRIEPVYIVPVMAVPALIILAVTAALLTAASRRRGFEDEND